MSSKEVNPPKELLKTDMKKIIQKVIEKMIEDGWITKNPHLVDAAISAAIEDAMRNIKVKDFLDAFYD